MELAEKIRALNGISGKLGALKGISGKIKGP